MSRLKQIEIALADDLDTDQALLTWHIKSDKRFHILFYATNGYDLLHKLQSSVPHIVVLDMYMPYMGGLEAIDHFKKVGYAGKTLVVSNSYEEEIVSKLAGKSVSGFCRKSGTCVLQALTAIADGKTYWDSPYEVAHRSQRPFPSLTDYRINGAEIEIVNKLALGMSCEEISKCFGCYTTATVETYVQRMIARFGLRNRAHLVAFAYVNGLLFNMEGFLEHSKPRGAE